MKILSPPRSSSAPNASSKMQALPLNTEILIKSLFRITRLLLENLLLDCAYILRRLLGIEEIRRG